MCENKDCTKCAFSTFQKSPTEQIQICKNMLQTFHNINENVQQIPFYCNDGKKIICKYSLLKKCFRAIIIP